MFVSFLAALVGVAAIELICRLMKRSSPSQRRSLFESLINIVSTAAGVTLGFRLASQLETAWQGALVAALVAALVVALGQVAIHYCSKAQQNAQTDRA